MNICSVIVHCKPENAPEVKHQLEQFDGVEIHGGMEQGKLIVTIEADGQRALSDVFEAFGKLTGVADTAMVYHQEEDDEKLDEVI